MELACVICGQVRGGAGGLRPDRIRDRHVSIAETLASSFAFIKKTDQSVVRGRPLYFSPMQRARVDYADISEEDRANILRNTAAGLLGLEPAASSL